MIFNSDFQEPESVLHRQCNTRAVMNKKDLGIGTLYISESVLSWNGPQNFSIEYAHISVHAVSKDVNIYPSGCLYLQVENFGDDEGENVENGDVESKDSDNESESTTTELLLIPEDVTVLQQMYEAIVHCHELHPDSDLTDEDEAFEDMIEDRAIDMEIIGDGPGNLQNLSLEEDYGSDGDATQEMDEEQFQDAD